MAVGVAVVVWSGMDDPVTVTVDVEVAVWVAGTGVSVEVVVGVAMEGGTGVWVVVAIKVRVFSTRAVGVLVGGIPAGGGVREGVGIV